jgi:hypothetical protein
MRACHGDSDVRRSFAEDIPLHPSHAAGSYGGELARGRRVSYLVCLGLKIVCQWLQGDLCERDYSANQIHGNPEGVFHRGALGRAWLHHA